MCEDRSTISNGLYFRTLTMKDLLGQDLAIGDHVIIAAPKGRQIVSAKIVQFIDHHVCERIYVNIKDSGWNTSKVVFAKQAVKVDG